MMGTILNITIWSVLLTHISLLVISAWKVWRGENIIDRLIGLDVATTLVLIILVLIAVIEDNSLYFDVAIGLAAMSAIATIALAKYVADQRMF